MRRSKPYEALGYSGATLVARERGLSSDDAAIRLVKKMARARGPVSLNEINVYKDAPDGSQDWVDIIGGWRKDELWEKHVLRGGR